MTESPYIEDAYLDTDAQEPTSPDDVFAPGDLTGGEAVDSDGNGVVDALLFRSEGGAHLVVMDLDHDTRADGLVLDSNGDGIADVWIVKEESGYRVEVDTDGDGRSDASKTLSRQELLARAPEVVEMLDLQFADGPAGPVDGALPADGTVGLEPTTEAQVVDGTLIGDPAGGSEHWFQQAQDGFCLPASMAQIVSEYTGVHYGDEAAFVDLANEHGAFSVGMDGVPGIEFAKGAELLQASGVLATYEFGDLEGLATDLAEGKGVIVFIDSGEYWQGEASEDNAADHAVVVTAIDLERQTVVLSDPGRPGGDQMEVPVELFDNAWADSNHAMIVCDEPAPGAAPEASDELAPAALGPDGRPVDGRPDPTTGPDVEGQESVSKSIHQNGWVLLPFLTGLSADRISG